MKYELLGLLAIIAYFAPTITAYLRKKNNKLAIAALNTFTGWTLAGWVASLVWALTNNKQTKKD